MAELVRQIEIEATIEAVWAEITAVDRVQRPLLNTMLVTTFEAGTPVRYESRDGTRTFVVGRVVEVGEPTVFSHTYVMTLYDEPPTLVTWSLERVGHDRVHVTLRHSGWAEQGKAMAKHGKTWERILADLKHQVERGDVSRKTKLSQALMGTFMFAMPSRTRSENVQVP
ncbi:MAG: SRPBCC domain-containing protein [Ornithinimicrobium sp.]